MNGLGGLLFNSLKKYDDKVMQFLDDTNEINTYSDILIRSIRTAIKLRENGIGGNDIISCCTHNHKNSCVPLIASQFLGVISANFDPNLSHLDTIHLLKLIQPKIIFVSEEALDFMETCLNKANICTQLVIFGISTKYAQFSEYVEPSTEENHFHPVQIKNEKDTGMILFSSGTTGLPKGICINHKSLMRAGDWTELKFNLDGSKNCVFLLYTSLYWISAVFSLIKCISNGYSQVIRKQFDPAYTWTLIEKYKITMMFLAPYDARDFLNANPKNVDVGSLEIFLTGSCPVSKRLMEDLKEELPHTKVINGYGSTELAGCITFFDVGNEADYKLQLLKPTSCGKLTKGAECRIVDVNSERLLGSNEEGEIRIKADYLMNGYYKMDTSSAFDTDGYLKTGDLGYFDKDACFYVVGRIKEIFKYRGWHILPAIIEEILMSHPAVKEAAVLGIPHELDGEHPMGVVVLFEEYDDVTAEDIEVFVNDRVSDKQKLRAGVKIIKYIPKTTTGKMNKGKLREVLF